LPIALRFLPLFHKPMNEYRRANSLPPRRIAWIDLSKGVAIFLVVFAHLMKYESLPLPDWYAIAKQKIYLFHMPFFMFLSGYVFFYSNHHRKALNDFLKYVAGRANRLLVPFFTLGLLVVLAKVILSNYFFIEEAPSSILDGLTSIFIHTESSPVLTIWYLAVLFVFSIITPQLLKLSNGRLECLFIISIVCYFVDVTDFMYVNRVFQFYPFFLLGGIYLSCAEANAKFIKLITVPMAVLFLYSITVPFDRTFGLLICGTLSCFAIPQAIRFTQGRFDRAILFLGDNTMIIYLLNVPCIGLVKALYIKVFLYEVSDFYVLGCVLLVSGIIIPVAIKLFICRVVRFERICRYIA